ncbi:MAG TPA: hypothetical protein VJB95_00600 [Candidatus Paceibacterota bacterium]
MVIKITEVPLEYYAENRRDHPADELPGVQDSYRSPGSGNDGGR